MVKHSPAPWKLYSGKLRPRFPTPILEIHDKNGEALVAWLGFDGVKQSPARKLVNARLFAKAWLIPELVEALEQAQSALDGVVRSAGQSSAGFLAGRRQVAKAEIAARAVLVKAKEPGDG